MMMAVTAILPVPILNSKECNFKVQKLNTYHTKMSHKYIDPRVSLLLRPGMVGLDYKLFFLFFFHDLNPNLHHLYYRTYT